MIGPQVSAQRENSAAWLSTVGIRDAATQRKLREFCATAASSPWSSSSAKRLFDVIVSLLVLLAFSIPGLLIALVVRLTSKGPAIFVQDRVGRGGALFKIYKFRTMQTASGAADGPTLTQIGDYRVTAVGRWLRKLKLDELPQFYNVLRGDMSLIGPRPKLPQYCDIFDQHYRPGITGAATLAFRREEDLMSHVPPGELDAFYNARIKPLKTLIDVRYMACGTFFSDVGLVLATFVSCLASGRFSRQMTRLLLSKPLLEAVDRIECEHKSAFTSALPDSSQATDEMAEVA